MILTGPRKDCPRNRRWTFNLEKLNMWSSGQFDTMIYILYYREHIYMLLWPCIANKNKTCLSRGRGLPSRLAPVCCRMDECSSRQVLALPRSLLILQLPVLEPIYTQTKADLMKCDHSFIGHKLSLIAVWTVFNLFNNCCIFKLSRGWYLVKLWYLVTTIS